MFFSKIEGYCLVMALSLWTSNFWLIENTSTKNIVTSLPKITHPSKIYEESVVGKQRRNQFSKRKSWRAKDVLELVHSDLCGPIKLSSNGGKNYLITFTDDFSRKTWVYFLQNKSEAFSFLKASRLV